MSETKHTPGPWEVDLSGTVIARVMKGGFMVAKIRKLAHAWHEQVANAHLIAAAPELLEALQAIIADVEQDESDFGYAADAPLIVAARAAIAKAGVQP